MTQLILASKDENVKGISGERSDEAEGRFQVRDQRKASWFWVDNDLIDSAGPFIGPTAGAVYISLARHADHSSQSCYPSLKTLAQEWGLSRPTVIRALKTLERYGLIQVKRHPQAARLHIANVYILTPPTAWRLPAQAGQSPKPAKKHDLDRGIGRASKGDLLALVNDVDQPSKGGLPQPDPSNQTNNNHHGGANAPHDVSVGNGPGAMTANIHDDDSKEGSLTGANKEKLLTLVKEFFQPQAAAAPPSQALPTATEGNGTSERLEAALRALGHDQPRKLITQALKRGWSEEGLARAIEAVARANGKIKNKPAFITSLLERGPDQARSILKSYSVASNQIGTDVERLKRQYKALIVERGELLLFLKEEPLRQDFQRRLAELEEEGRAIAAELREAGVDPEEVKAEVCGGVSSWPSAEIEQSRSWSRQ